jgi:hypothetical protein
MLPACFRALSSSYLFKETRVACQSACGNNPVGQYNVPARFRQSIRPRGAGGSVSSTATISTGFTQIQSSVARDGNASRSHGRFPP